MVDVLHVIARNVKGGPMGLSGCAIVLPLGVRIYSDPPQLDYPYELESGAECKDAFECKELAAKARDCGYKGRITLDAMFLETGGMRLPDAPMLHIAAEHRSGPFVFDTDRWT
jgi:hypothetical protein